MRNNEKGLSWKNKVKYTAYRSSTIVILLLVLAFFEIINMVRGNNYLTMNNISIIINQASFLTLVGLAQLLVVLTGGINLAIGSIMVLVCIMAGQTISEDGNVFFLIPVLIILVLSSAIGWLTGAVVTKRRIPSFIATFAIMYVFRGIGWITMGRSVIYRINPAIRFLAGGRLFSFAGFTITMPVVITLFILLVLGFVLKKSSFGRQLYFTGSNGVSSRFSGVPTDKIVMKAYILSGLLCGVSAVLYTGRLNAVEPSMYGNTHFDAVAVVLIGGASMAGGRGDVWSTAVGAIIITVIQSGMNSIQVPSEFQTFVLGVLIILSVILNQSLQKKKDILENDTKD